MTQTRMAYKTGLQEYRFFSWSPPTFLQVQYLFSVRCQHGQTLCFSSCAHARYELSNGYRPVNSI